MNRRLLSKAACLAALPLLLWSCGSAPSTPEADETSPETGTADGEVGQLEIRANGEDFVREGFVTKDGWEISFDHVYVTVAEVTAYQSEPAFDAQAGGMPQAEKTIAIADPITLDLAEGDESAEPILVGTLEAAAGRYNALSWKMVPATEGPATGQVLLLQGTATKDGETLDFVLELNQPLGFVCGDFVGDERKGILTANDTADLEMTFHFDHLFGDGGAPPEDDINTGALGFDPFAALAMDGAVAVDAAALEAGLAPAEYDQLLGILPSLGHVGEGHCTETELSK